MEFNLVSVPETAANGVYNKIIDAMTKNIGKAIEIPLEDRDPNAFRKTLRSSISAKGLLKDYKYRTQVDTERKTIIVWFEPIVEPGV